jgi:hypothetical protein
MYVLSSQRTLFPSMLHHSVYTTYLKCTLYNCYQTTPYRVRRCASYEWNVSCLCNPGEYDHGSPEEGADHSHVSQTITVSMVMTGEHSPNSGVLVSLSEPTYHWNREIIKFQRGKMHHE